MDDTPEVSRTRSPTGNRRFLISLAIVAASVCLALGVSLPIIKLTRFYYFTSEHSLISAVWSLLQSGQDFLGLVVLVFAILLPVLKLVYLVIVATLPEREQQRVGHLLHALEWIGRWSMHDVLVLSLTIFFIKSRVSYDARSLNGIYFFTAAVLLMMVAYAGLRSESGAPGPSSIAHAAAVGRRSPWGRVVLSLLVILAAVFFALGVMLPAIRFTTVYVWTNEHSIATIIWALYQARELPLCLVVFLFSIAFPILKLLNLLAIATAAGLPAGLRRRSLPIMEWLGRYSMTDVMVLALLVFYVNSSGYAQASVLPGVHFFAASALMTMLAYAWANSDPHPARD